MSRNLFFFTSLLIVFSFLTSCSSAPKNKQSKTVWKCDAKDEAEIDEMAAKMITLGREDMKLPLKTAEIKPFCKRELRMLSRGETYKDQCMRGQQKQVFAVAIYTLKQFIQQLCRRPKSRKTQELLKAVPCINSGAKEYNKCNIQYIDILESVRDWKGNFKGQIAHVCCGYYDMFNCVREAGSRVPACTRQTIEMLLDLVRLNTENVVNMLCGEYTSDTDRCDKVRLLAGRGGNSTNKNRSQSFVKPLITILANEDG